MNIFLYEIKTYIKSVIIWSAAILGLLFTFMAFFPAFSSDTALLEQMLENYPEEILKAFGMSSSLSLSSISGYFAFIFLFVQLCIAIQSANYGFHLLSVEERELTADFLMSKPVSRNRIIISKFLAAFTSLTITNIFIWLGSFGSIILFSDGGTYSTENIILLLLTIIFFQLFFLSGGMVISVSIKKIRNVLTFSMAFSFGMYIIYALQSIVGGKFLGILTPFSHFEPSYIIKNGHYNIPMTIISLIVIIFSLTASYLLYKKRNIFSAV